MNKPWVVLLLITWDADFECNYYYFILCKYVVLLKCDCVICITTYFPCVDCGCYTILVLCWFSLNLVIFEFFYICIFECSNRFFATLANVERVAKCCNRVVVFVASDNWTYCCNVASLCVDSSEYYSSFHSPYYWNKERWSCCDYRKAWSRCDIFELLSS